MSTVVIKNELKKDYSNLIQKNIPLHNKNWFETGGPARFFAEPFDAESFARCLSFAKENNLEIFVLGKGANVLISDEGFDGLVIRPQLNEITFSNYDNENVLVTAGAGLSFADLIDACLDNNILGLEEFSGIPGTVGGSVFINLHYFEFLLSQFLVRAQVIEKETGKILTVDNNWFEFGYNKSKLQERKHFLISATLKVKKGNELQSAYAKGRRDETIRHRSKRYPTKGTCGSFFRNFYEDEVTLEVGGKKIIFVAYYLDKIGVKGQLKHGNAMVSYQHANMLVNLGGATTNDIIQIVRTMQQKVRDAFGIVPKPECLLIGFKEYPLMD